MAVLHDAPVPADGEIAFLIGDTASPVPSRYSLPYETMVEVAAHFVDSSGRHDGVGWEEV